MHVQVGRVAHPDGNPFPRALSLHSRRKACFCNITLIQVRFRFMHMLPVRKVQMRTPAEVASLGADVSPG